jgi:hypothetical protein
MLVVMGPVLWTIHRASPYYRSPHSLHQALPSYNNIPLDHGLSNISYCFFICFGALLQQGSTTVPSADSGRVLTGFWWLFVIVTVTTYCGNLVAFLTFPTIEYPISDLNTLVEKVDSVLAM